MSSYTSTARLHEPTALKVILLAALIAGTLDITAATIHFLLNGAKDPIRIFYYIASGVFGREIAYGSGKWMAIVGLAFHYFIAFIWSLFMFFIYPWIKSALRNKILIGVFYGIFVWVVMSKLIVPLSNTPSPANPPAVKQQIIGCLILIFCIGIPITWIVDRYYKSRLV